MTTSRNRATPPSLRAGDHAVRRADGAPPAPFDGFPYLVVRIGRTPLRHLAVLPADWPRTRLVDLARRQAEANQLEVCLCLGPADAVYVSPGGAPRPAAHLPTGIPVAEQLATAGPIEDTPELRARHDALRAWADRHRASGYLVGDGLRNEHPAHEADVARLSGPGVDGLPPGLRRCPGCSDARGEVLNGRGMADSIPVPVAVVVEVRCRCDNHNRCAGCGRPLADHRLSAWYWDEERRGAWYVAAYCGLSHRCPADAVTPRPVRGGW